MELNITAELRFIEEKKIQTLIEASELKEIIKIKKSLFGLMKKNETEYIDNFEEYLNENSELIDTFDNKGFLVISDLVEFLKKYKKINIDKSLFKDVSEKLTEREEHSIFINYEFSNELNEKLENILIEEIELMKFYEETIGMPIEKAIPFQKDQISRLIKVIKMIKPDFALYIRGEG